MNITSLWGDGRRITAKGAVIAAGGQRLWLNETGDGIVVEYTDKDGSTKRFAVALANSRTQAKWQEIPRDVTGLIDYDDFSGTLIAGMTDAQINALVGYDASTAVSNTTAILAAGVSAPAAEWCRSKTIGGLACDLANMNQLRRIFVLKAEMDSLDYTVATNPSMALDTWDFGGACWSSTERSNQAAWMIAKNGNANGSTNKQYQGGVIPILELA